MAKHQKYDNTSISSLKGADRVRLRPSVIFGSDGLEGCQHSFFEILSNSIDESREGFGNHIEVTRFADKSIEIVDHGRGIPVDFNPKEDRFNWELVYCELYAGGKYKNNSGDNYEFSLGLNGLGSCATQYSSEYMDVTVMRDGFKYSLHFEKGENVGGLTKEPTRFKQTGTIQRWKPDLDVFIDINIPLDYFMQILKKQAVVNAGLRFTLYDQTAEGMNMYEFCYPNGIVDYIAECTGSVPCDISCEDAQATGKNFTSVQYFEAERRGRDREDKDEYKAKFQVAYCFSNETPLLEYYHNSSFLEHGGSPYKAARSAFVSAIDAYLRQTGKYQKSESKITFVDIADSLMLVSNSFSTNTSYQNQTKKAITNEFIQDAMTDILRHNLDIYFTENRTEADKIADQILVNKRSRESAEKARINIKKKLTGSIDVTNRISKFADCRSKDVQKREVYIVEGDSALGACKLGRDAEFQAIIPVRGKILNCLKADYDKIFKNDIIVDLIKVLGCGVEIKTKHNKEFNSFEPDLLRWGKVIICTDADVDGFHIRTMILTMLYRLVPSLIDMGKVYIAESPLFEITHKTGTFFAYTERERVDIINKFKDDKYKLQRSKGLGENEPDMMWLTTMNPETRRLVKVEAADCAATEAMFDLLLGDNLAGRKDFIAEVGGSYIDMADIS